MSTAADQTSPPSPPPRSPLRPARSNLPADPSPATGARGPSFTTADPRRDLTTSFKSYNAFSTALHGLLVLTASCRRLGERAEKVLKGVEEKLEAVDRAEEEREGGRRRASYEFEEGKVASDETVFRIQGLMLDLQMCARNLVSSSSKDLLQFVVLDFPSHLLSITSLSANFLATIQFYSLPISTSSWEEEDSADLLMDLGALPRLFKVSVALRGHTYEQFLEDSPISALVDDGSGSGSGSEGRSSAKRREAFIAWCLEKNLLLKPSDGDETLRKWTEMKASSPRTSRILPNKARTRSMLAIKPGLRKPGREEDGPMSAPLVRSFSSPFPGTSITPSPDSIPPSPEIVASSKIPSPERRRSPSPKTSPKFALQEPIEEEPADTVESSPPSTDNSSSDTTLNEMTPPVPDSISTPGAPPATLSPPELVLRPPTPFDRPPSPLHQPPLRILCLDGAGIRGLALLFTLRATLAALAPSIPTKFIRPCEMFDFIVGVSTGGLIAILLGRLRLSCDEAIDAYISIAEQAFHGKVRTSPKSPWARLFGGGSSGAIPVPMGARDFLLEKSLRAIPDSLMSDGSKGPLMVGEGCHTAVLAFQEQSSRGQKTTVPRWFRSYESKEEDEGGSLDETVDGFGIREAIRATMASSQFFKPYSTSYNPPVTFSEAPPSHSLNPCDLTLTEVKRIFSKHSRFEIATFLSIGAGKVSDHLKLPSKSKMNALRVVRSTTVDSNSAWDHFVAKAKKEGLADKLVRVNVDLSNFGTVDGGIEEWVREEELGRVVARWVGENARPSVALLRKGMMFALGDDHLSPESAALTPAPASSRNDREQEIEDMKPLRPSLSLADIRSSVYIQDKNDSTGSL